MKLTIIRTVYSFLAWLTLPLVLLVALSKPKWRVALWERLGVGVEPFASDEVKLNRIWLHGASVGEIAGLSPVIRQLEAEFPEWEILVTTTSRTGREEVFRRKLKCSTCLLPFDHPYFVRRFVRKVKPSVVVISETEVWPSLYFELQRLEVPCVIINGRISEFSFPKYRAFSWFFKAVLVGVDNLLVQTKLDASRFTTLGVSNSRIAVTGSTKYDQSSLTDNKKLVEFRTSLGLEREKREKLCFVAGSVRPEEDEIIIRSFVEVRKENPELQMIIAPRHPQKFEDVASVLQRHDVTFWRRSSSEVNDKSIPVVLLDTLGELQLAYALGDIAFVGGTLVNIGGHNPLEPAAYRCPVIVGPYTSNVKDVVAQMRSRRGIIEVKNETQLVDELTNLLSSSELRSKYGEAAHEVWQNNIGATNRVMNVVREYLKDFNNKGRIKRERKRA